MIYAAFNWLNFSISALVVVLVIVCLVMSLVILMQRPKNEGLGAAFGSGTTDQLFGAETTSVLQKTTRNLAVAFFIITPLLSWAISKKNHASQANSLVKPVAVEVSKVPDTTPAPAPVTPPVVQKPAETQPTPAPVAPPETPSAPK